MVIETTDSTTGIVVGPETETITEMGIGTIIDQIIEEMIVARGMEIEIGTTVGLEKGIERGVVQRESSQSRGGNQSQSRNDNRRTKQKIILGIDLNQDQDQVPM